MAELQVKVKMTDIEEIKRYMEITKRFIDDERIPAEVREEYTDAIIDVLKM